MTTAELIPAFEAVLFSGGEPISIDRFSQVFDIKPERVVEVMEALSKKLNGNDRGVGLVRMENTYQLATKNEYAGYIKKMFDIKRRTPLSPAALEVLAVVAYNQPVTKSFVEQVRGVDCSGVISTLCQRNLIEEHGRLDLPGRPLLYCTTDNFLRCFEISSLDELPELPEKTVSEAIDKTQDVEGQMSLV